MLDEPAPRIHPNVHRVLDFRHHSSNLPKKTHGPGLEKRSQTRASIFRDELSRLGGLTQIKLAASLVAPDPEFLVCNGNGQTGRVPPAGKFTATRGSKGAP